MRRDNGRCVVPGCKNHAFVDIHHLELRSEGGDHRAENLVVLCSAHHRALHRGTLVVDGRPGEGLRFRHVDGTRYGAVPSPSAVATFGKVFFALRSMGFREKESRRALETVRARHSGSRCDVERVLREALAVLTDEIARAS